MKHLFGMFLLAAIVHFGLAPGEARAQEVCPDNFSAYADSGETVQCLCEAEATQRGSIWGTDIYTTDSSVCRAALHAGVITRRGGPVTITARPGEPRYLGVTRNGVVSSNYGPYRSSFVFAVQRRAGEPAATPLQPAEASQVCPDNFSAYADSDETVRCTCSPEATQKGSIWGSDVYTTDSSVCRAALHAGVINRRGGPVTVVARPGERRYLGVTRNGITSSNYGPYKTSFVFEGGPRTTTQSAPICPDNYAAFTEDDEPYACTCDALATTNGSIWGTDVYTADSGICRAARHAGVLGPNGGQVVVVPRPGQERYVGVTRNGVTSSNYGPYKLSFAFEGAPRATPRRTEPAPRAETAPRSGDVCPDNFVAYADTTEPVGCACQPDAIARGSVWGFDVYTADSSVCRAALHAGVVGPRGGEVVVIPEPGRERYVGVTRNGVTSSNYGPYKSSFRFRAAERPVVIGDRPAQAPVASTLRETGQVQLYIQFRTNSAELDPGSYPTLLELQEALRGDPGLRLVLVGHTDAVGTPQYNLDLSRRRAQSVADWLVQQGIPRNRLGVDGKGLTQPIADNQSEEGRALNRRVQALRVQ